ncbi:hypothetical protein M9H77_02227 [Catharanthus roseus]|uniref:Uncharacterized protein n=1 Tax=Catharanthus roseus TaxID=4058 RepID=A0ACC0C7X4_CATRO|nr:hypothetical protein M9H77_02227 [Catharanthus roseus]
MPTSSLKSCSIPFNPLSSTILRVPSESRNDEKETKRNENNENKSRWQRDSTYRGSQGNLLLIVGVEDDWGNCNPRPTTYSRPHPAVSVFGIVARDDKVKEYRIVWYQYMSRKKRGELVPFSPEP